MPGRAKKGREGVSGLSVKKTFTFYIMDELGIDKNVLILSGAIAVSHQLIPQGPLGSLGILVLAYMGLSYADDVGLIDVKGVKGRLRAKIDSFIPGDGDNMASTY